MLRRNPTVIQLSIFQKMENICLCFLFGIEEEASCFAGPPFTEFESANAQMTMCIGVAERMQCSPMVIRKESEVRHGVERNTVKVGSKPGVGHSGL